MHTFPIALLAAALAVSPVATLPKTGVEPAQAPSAPFPMPKAGIAIAATTQDGGPSLTDLLTDFAAVAGQNFSIDMPTRQVLDSTPVGLLCPVEVPAAEVYSYVEHLLVNRGFVIEELRDEEPRLLAIQHLATRSASGGPVSRNVPVEEIALYRRHPALVISTVMDLPHIDVRQLGNSLRAILSDQAAQSIIPVGNMNSVILRGTGQRVAELVGTLQELEESAKAAYEAMESQSPGQEESSEQGAAEEPRQGR